MNQIFGGIRMTWLKVIVFAIAAGAYTGAVMLIPALRNTSFQDIGIAFEWWVIFAVIVVVNCTKSWEAALKCFLFFLISQPMVYIVEMVFGGLSFEMAWYYYRAVWFKATLLTLPGGFIAYFCKKQNFWGSVVMALGNTIMAAMGYYYFTQLTGHFPHHLLSMLVCLAGIFVMGLCIQKNTHGRIIAIAGPFVLVAVGLIGLSLLHIEIF